MGQTWQRWFLLAATGILSGCSPRASLTLGPQAVEAAGHMLNPAGPSSILTTSWDAEVQQIRIQVVDASNGAPALDSKTFVLEDSGRDVATYGFSPDESTVAVLTGTGPFCVRFAGGSACWPGAESLHRIDLRTRRTESYSLGAAAYIPVLAFSPDGGSLAFGSHGPDGFAVRRLRSLDVDPVDSAPLSFLPSFLAFSIDGRELIALGDSPGDDPGMTEPGPLTVAVLDAESLAVLWQETLAIRHGSWCLEGCTDSHEQTLFANWTPAVVRLPGTDEIVIVHADEDRLTMIDAALRLVHTRPILAPRTWLDRLMALGTMTAEAKGGSEGAYRQAVASADGTRLFLVGREFHAWQDSDGWIQMSDTPLGMQVIDPATGARLAAVPTDADHVSLSEDGEWALLRTWAGPQVRTEILPTGSLDTARAVEGWDVSSVRDLEGRSILLATSTPASLTRVALVDPTTLEIGPRWSVPAATTLLLP